MSCLGDHWQGFVESSVGAMGGDGNAEARIFDMCTDIWICECAVILTSLLSGTSSTLMAPLRGLLPVLVGASRELPLVPGNRLRSSRLDPAATRKWERLCCLRALFGVPRRGALAVECRPLLHGCGARALQDAACREQAADDARFCECSML